MSKLNATEFNWFHFDDCLSHQFLLTFSFSTSCTVLLQEEMLCISCAVNFYQEGFTQFSEFSDMKWNFQIFLIILSSAWRFFSAHHLLFFKRLVILQGNKTSCKSVNIIFLLPQLLIFILSKFHDPIDSKGLKLNEFIHTLTPSILYRTQI